MSDLPWLVRADGPEPERRLIERTQRASLDLGAVAQSIDGYLVLHDAVDIAFALADRHLPRGTLDLRGGDPLGHALGDARAVVVTAGGSWIGMPIERDGRWALLADLGWPRVVLGSGGLSGAYLGCTLYDPDPRRFLDGVAEQVVGVAARVVYDDGSVLVVERTTIGFRSRGVGPERRSPRMATLVQAVPGIPTRVTSELLDADELATLLADAGRLPPTSLTLNGRRWR